MTVVVTGAAGLLGEHVVAALLAARRDVRAVDLVAPAADVAWVRADLRDPAATRDALAGAHAVVHAAGIPRPAGHAPEAVFATNVLGAQHVAQAAVAHGTRRLVSASSVSVLGIPFNPRPLRPAYLPVDEDHPLAPQEAYALSKLVTEEVVAAATRSSDLTAVSLRLPWIQTARAFGRDVVPHRREVGRANLWSYVDARDAAEAVVRALDAPVDGHAAVFLTAPDTFMEEPTEALVRASLGDVPLRRPLPGHAPALDGARTERLLGVRPARTWRDYAAEAA